VPVHRIACDDREDEPTGELQTALPDGDGVDGTELVEVGEHPRDAGPMTPTITMRIARL
jgi:hypothetical protein